MEEPARVGYKGARRREGSISCGEKITALSIGRRERVFTGRTGTFQFLCYSENNILWLVALVQALLPCREAYMGTQTPSLGNPLNLEGNHIHGC